MYRVTFLNGCEGFNQKGLKTLKPIEKGLEVLKSVRSDLDLFLFPDSVPLKDLLEKLESFGYKVDLNSYTLADLDDLDDNVRELVNTAFQEYGLCFGYVEGGTKDNPGDGYWRYQITGNGPSYEVRFYKDELIEFVYLDWSVGVGFDVTNDIVFRELRRYFKEMEMLKEEG